MIPENAAYAYVGAFVEELARCGVRHLCLCPGSRSTPLAIVAAREPGLQVWTLIDERSAGFFALGIAKGSRTPVALLSTSGTAAANFLPAVVEARYGRVPLVVLTADRPHELRESAAAQTIDQTRLYGTHVKWFLDAALPEATDAMLRYARVIAAQAVAAAMEAPQGAAHLNFPLREPLVPIAAPAELPPLDAREGAGWSGRGDAVPYATIVPGSRRPPAAWVAHLAQDLADVERGVIVCGPMDDPALPAAVARLAAALDYPVLADPLSQVRCGRHSHTHVIDAYDAALRAAGLVQFLAPDAVLRFGGTPASRPLLTYLQRAPRARHIVVDVAAAWNDPTRLASEFVQTDPAAFCDALAAAVPSEGRPDRPGAWVSTWHTVGASAHRALQQALSALEEPFEGKVFSELAPVLPDGAVLYIGNSMPVRDLDSFLGSSDREIRLLGNRGASGIDGLVSSALGVAASGVAPVVAVLGDLAFYHDMNGLLAAKRYGLRATIVVLNNDGGGIFSFLPQASYPEHFEALFGTPHGLDFEPAARMYGASFARPRDWGEFTRALRAGLAGPGLSIVEVRTARDRNVALHQQVWTAVDSAVRAALGDARPGGR